MASISFGSAIAFVAAAASLLGCASGPVSLVGYKVPKRQQVAIVIDISDQAKQADQSGAIATLAETVANRLKENGIDSQLYASKYDHPKPPRIDIFVSNWSGTSEVARWWFSPAARNSIVVECKVTLPGQDKPAFTQHFEKSSASGTGPEYDSAAAESVGDAIVDAISKR